MLVAALGTLSQCESLQELEKALKPHHHSALTQPAEW